MAEERFARAARRLSRIAAQAFGWTPDTFWNATPAEFAALFETDEEPAEALLTQADLQAMMERDDNGR